MINHDNDIEITVKGRPAHHGQIFATSVVVETHFDGKKTVLVDDQPFPWVANNARITMDEHGIFSLSVDIPFGMLDKSPGFYEIKWPRSSHRDERLGIDLGFSHNVDGHCTVCGSGPGSCEDKVLETKKAELDA